MNVAEKIPIGASWDAQQLAVIRAGSDARIIVEAGPGTGKTAVACARLAHLISNEGIEPSNAWMISFTRTAVAEIRARLHSYVGDASFAIRVATIDSHAWSIHSGHDPNARLTGSYEENIERVIKLVRDDEDVDEELSRIEHFVVDEAQDLLGRRADLVMELVERLHRDCGVTVFADEAQAIYGFSDDRIGRGKGNSKKPGKPLLGRLRAAKGPGFSTLPLSEIYRTSSPGLKRISSELRTEILDARNWKEGMHAETARKITSLADKRMLKWIQRKKVEDYSSDDIILFRTRAEVLMTSQFCKGPHRLRLSGYRATLPSWLALCFFDFTERFLADDAFLKLWSVRVENKASPEYGPVEAWSRLLRVAGRKDGSIDMRMLRRRLSQNRPPVDLAALEYGLHGPVVGTIHASKGREASNVVLLLPRRAGFDNVVDEVEEARVLFVGATRAKASLMVGGGRSSRASSLPSGRTYGRTWAGKTMIEIGRTGDISADGLVGRTDLSPTDAAEAQRFLARVSDVVTSYVLQADSDLNFRYRIMANSGGICVGALTPNVVNDLREILRLKSQLNSHRPPDRLNHINGLGCSTMVLASDDSRLDILHEPWASSGFLLAPRISAYPPFYFHQR